MLFSLDLKELPVLKTNITCCVIFLLLTLPAVTHAENWPQWRGPQGNGVSPESSIPLEWSRTKNVLWRTGLPGAGGATPAVWGDNIFVTSAEGKDLVLLCIGTDGKQKWKQTITTGNREVRSGEGNSAAPSPSTDGKHVWAFFANGALCCYTVDGEKVWQFNTEERYGKLKNAFGMTSTPILDKGVLYLQLIQGDQNVKTQEAMLVALQAETGKEIWAVKRGSDAIRECEHSYASPTIYRDKEREFLLAHGADYLSAHRLTDGSEIWRCGDLNPKGKYNPTLRFVASPLAIDGMIVAPSAKNGPVFAIKADATPDDKGHIAGEDSFFWKRLRGTPDVPTPLAKDGLVYLCRENGNLVCVDAATGEEYYNERTVADRHRASPVYAAGHILITSRRGVVTVVKAGKEFEVVSKNDLEESTTASPAIAGGRVYIRTFEALYAIGAK